MSYPTPLNISYSYTGFATGLGDASFPGTQLDADLANVELSVDELLTFIQTSFTAEGVLKVAAMPTASDLMGYAGVLVQRAYASTGDVDTTAATIPNDDTIPQNTEGKEFLTVSITPKSATNILRVTTELNLSPSASTFMIVALFRDSTANAFAAGGQSGSGASEVRRIVLTHEVVAGSTSATTFRVRAGNGGSGTLTLNGNGGSRLFGGVLISSIRVDEIKA